MALGCRLQAGCTWHASATHLPATVRTQPRGRPGLAPRPSAPKARTKEPLRDHASWYVCCHSAPAGRKGPVGVMGGGWGRMGDGGRMMGEGNR